MPALKNIIGNKYNSLTVVERAENINGRVAWKCQCDCGRYTIKRTGDLTPGHTKTCGNCDNVFDAVMYEFKNGYVVGHVKNGREFLIDEEDIFKIKDFNISVDVKGYSSFSLNGISIPLHRFLMNPPQGMVVDHINRIPSDNRKSNLRICSQSENLRNITIQKNNTSGITGVYYIKRDERWGADIMVNYNRVYLGSFKNIEDATKVRKEAEEKYFGEFATK